MKQKSTSNPSTTNKRQKKNNTQNFSGSFKQSHEYKCGDQGCGKYYHSYTAFYNHCKKSHEGNFPKNSEYNGQIFEGPSKNRGRPKIKKTEAKDQAQIQSLKTENQLIELIGTLPKKTKNQEIIVYVGKPLQHLSEAVKLSQEFTEKENNFFNEVLQLNQIITKNDLPDFYDPIDIKQYSDLVDSYSFTNIYFYLSKMKELKEFDSKLMYISLIIWLARNVSAVVLSEIIYIVYQILQNQQNSIEMNKDQYFFNKINKFLSLTQKYFECIKNQHQNPYKEEIISQREHSLKEESLDFEMHGQMGQDQIVSNNILQ